MVIASVVCIASWRLVYAFVEEEKYWEEEKALGENREIAQISYFVSMLVFAVDLLSR
jgi:hypothetical protein